MLEEKLKEFESRNVQLIACSTDSEQSHWGWLQVDKEDGGIKGVNYPILADIDKTISMNYDVLFGDYEVDENERITSTGPMIAFRGLFIIDADGIIQHVTINNLPVGRNVDETLRLIAAFKHVQANPDEVCPMNWTPGDKTMLEDPKGSKEYFSAL